LLTVTLFTREACHLCEQAKADLKALQEIIPHRLVEVDIEQDEALLKAYSLEIPVVQAGPYTVKAPFDRQKLQITLGAANDRKTQLDKIGHKEYQDRVARGRKITRADRFTYWFSRHYLLVINLMVLLYVGLPALAPVLMRAGLELPAAGIYRVYGGMCHQLAYRSFFLFGEQLVYPREEAGVAGYLTFEQATNIDADDQWAARQFRGNERVGYKTGLCQRDMAIYSAILLFGIIFAISGRRLKSLPIWAWILFGVVPIGVDGVSQLLSQWAVMLDISALQWIPFRESTPFLRTFTGFLFGLTTAWFGYPLIEEAMADTRRLMKTKFAQVEAAEISETADIPETSQIS
jgi:uncharacterized membrane protein